MISKTTITIVLILGGVTAFFSPASAEMVIIENENFTASHDIAYDLIQAMPDAGCHGESMLVGLDAYDEWVEYDLTVSAFGIWSVSMVCKGDFNVGYSLQMTATGKDSGVSQTIDILYTGLGDG